MADVTDGVKDRVPGATTVAPAQTPVYSPPSKRDADDSDTLSDDAPLRVVMGAELDAITTRRRTMKPYATTEKARTSLAGLALSGGGIRSATFSLGALQALAEHKALKAFDYLSTVSGGGFVGGWWSAWLSRTGSKIDESCFPQSERLEPKRAEARAIGGPPGSAIHSLSQQPEGSLSVQQGDPVHHLRLFANYLTPRTGILSGDTWRAVTVISRNMLLTWVVLIPVFLAVVLLAQLYFVGRDDIGYSFACSRPDSIRVTPRVGGGADSQLIPRVGTSSVCSKQDSTLASKKVPMTDVDRDAVFAANHSHRETVARRFAILTDPLISGAVVIVACTALWVLFGSQSLRTTALSLGFLLVITVIMIFGLPSSGAASATSQQFLNSRWRGFTVVVVLAFTVFGLAPWWNARRGVHPGQSVARDAVRNTIVRWQARALVILVVSLAGLLIAGFGHEVVWYLFAPQSGSLWNAARQKGGWLALLAATGSTAFTLVKSFPSPRANDAQANEPKLLSKIVLAIAPALAIVSLGIACAWIGQTIIATGSQWSNSGYVEQNNATASIFVSAVVLALLAGAEAVKRPGERRPPGEAWPRLLIAAAAIVVFIVSIMLVSTGEPLRRYAFGAIALAVAVSSWQWADDLAARLSTRVVALVGFVVSLLALVFIRDLRFDANATTPSLLFWLAIGVLALLIVASLARWVAFRTIRGRALVLATIAVVECASLVLMHFWPHHDAGIALRATAIGWASFFIAWVIALGWTIDPNLVSLHSFYKARIVRAYLGASNVDEREMREISETAPRDDLLLKDLSGHTKGAPLHLVNATLNLVGGRELSTAQRSAALFTMSSQMCGSARTGYCPTSKYMGGTLSLGSAIAASGAAVSPTMGTKSISAPLTLLLALFNVRLGFWAPAPKKEREEERQPTMWPFYLLSEAFSQTNDVGSYCYLTDGGHFDNTGVYALIERGCQWIYLLDDGADPGPCFSDLGTLIRRCRIDFGAEIELSDGVGNFRYEKMGYATHHFVCGTITYAPAHLRQLGWTQEEIDLRAPGRILWVKPAITEENSVDVQQYRLENNEFPQQTTVDQWYDEAQFESYRALGKQSMGSWLTALNGRIDPAKPRSLFPELVEAR